MDTTGPARGSSYAPNNVVGGISPVGAPPPLSGPNSNDGLGPVDNTTPIGGNAPADDGYRPLEVISSTTTVVESTKTHSPTVCS